MATTEEYAILSTCAYPRKSENATNVPPGWAELEKPTNDAISGFSAGVYSKNGEIVIAYTGTNQDKWKDFTTTNIPAVVGIPADQVFDAMKLYINVKKKYGGAISFTGHSLGGGLASLMAVFFGKLATTFDPAPFEATVENLNTLKSYQSMLKNDGLSDADFDFAISNPSFFQIRQTAVDYYSLKGEVLSLFRNGFPTVGVEHAPIDVGQQSVSMVDLHSMSLLSSMEISQKFRQMVQQVPGSLTPLFDMSLHARDPQYSNEPNFLDKLLKAQIGDSSKGEMPVLLLDKYGDDVIKLKGDAGIAQTQLRKELMAVAGDYYYLKKSEDATNIFTLTEGGLNFKYSDIGATSYKSLPRLATAVEAMLSPDEKIYAPLLLTKNAWHIQQGTSALIWAGTDEENDVAVGGVGVDILDGGAGTDILIGGAGSDVLNGGAGDYDLLLGGLGDDFLNGGAGDDMLLGGTGYDTYIYNNTDGKDVIIDSDGKGKVIFDGMKLTGGSRISPQTISSSDGKFYYNFRGTTAYVWRGDIVTDTTLKIQNWRNGSLGISLAAGISFGFRELQNYEEMRQAWLKGVDYAASSFATAGSIISPIVLDLNGDGVTTIDQNEGTYFDYNGDGLAEKTGWASGKDGFLVRDLNGNGSIDDGRELFGNDTVLANGSKAPNGFAALAELDSNHDGKIDASDSAFDTLKIWKDRNEDGVSSSDELLSLTAAGVQSINVGYITGSATDAQGNAHKQIGTYTTTSGLTRGADDVWFNVNRTDTITNIALTVPDDIDALPDLGGTGGVFDLHQAMVRDQTGRLTTLVGRVLAETSPEQRRILFEQLFLSWTGADIHTADSRGGYIADGRHLYAVEAMMGKSFLQGFGTNSGTPNPGPNAAKQLESTYTKLLDLYYNQFNAQTNLKTYYDAITFTWSDDANANLGDLTGAAALLATLLKTNRNYGLSQLGQFVEMLVKTGLTGITNVDQFRALMSPLGADVVAVIDAAWQDIAGTSSDDRLLGTMGNDILLGIGGNDTLSAFDGDDTLNGGIGNDVLIGGKGLDKYLFNKGDGQDIIVEDVVDDEGDGIFDIDTIRFGVGIGVDQVTITRDAYNLYLSYNYGADRITVDHYFDGGQSRIDRVEFADSSGVVWNSFDIESKLTIPVATEQADILFGTSSADTINGLAGNDIIAGQLGNDTLIGGKGDDQLNGGAGNDVYLFAKGDGQDTIDDRDSTVGNMDTIRFASSVLPTDVTITRDLNNLYVSINGTSDKITVNNWFVNDDFKVEKIEFTDGSGIVWDIAAIIAKAAIVTNGNDFLVGTQGADILSSSAGDDTVYGLSGDDTLQGGTGNDALFGGTGDDVYLFSKGDGHDVIKDDDGTDIVRFTSEVLPGDVRVSRDAFNLYLTLDTTGDQITIKDAFVFPSNSLEQVQFADGTKWNASDLFAKALTPTSDADYLFGSESADSIIGLAGSDQLFGNGGDDILDGGVGNDVLSGGSGNDVYVFGRGYGQDIVYDFDETSGNVDTIQLGADVLPSQLQVSREGMNLILSIVGSTDKLTLQEWFSSDANRIEQVKFNDGTVWTIPILASKATDGTEGADSLVGLYTDDVLNGLGGDDTIQGMDGADILSGGAGNDRVWGGVGNDILNGGIGNDVLVGGFGDDTYLFNKNWGTDQIFETDISDTNTIKFLAGILPTDIKVSMRGDDLILATEFNDNRVELMSLFSQKRADGTYSVKNIQFADGTIWNVLTLRDSFTIGGTGDDALTGFSDNDILNGGLGNDVLSGKFGNDTLIGGEGNDTLQGDQGDDTYVFQSNDGVDVIIESSSGSQLSNDKIVFGAGINQADLRLYRTSSTGEKGSKTIDDLVILSNVTKQEIRVVDFFNSNSDNRIETIEFADQTIWSTSDINSKIIDQTGTINQTVGTAGDNIFIVDHPLDTILENVGSGIDTVLSSVDFILPNEIENLELTGQFSINGSGNSLNNVLTGNGGNNVLDGLAGRDTLIGGNGDDTYYTEGYGLAYIASTDFYGSLDTVVEAADEGYDTIVASSYSAFLPDNVERLVLRGDLDLVISNGNGSGTISHIPRVFTGNGLNNVIDATNTKNAFTNIFGGEGADIMLAGAGSTNFFVDNIGDVAIASKAAYSNSTVITTVTYTLTTGLNNIALTGVNTINATGNELNNTLDGSKNTAINMLTGGLGDDTYILGDGDQAVELANGGNDTVIIGAGAVGNYFMSSLINIDNIENIGIGDALGASNLTGNSGNNVVYGNRSNNILDGGAGDDILFDTPDYPYDYDGTQISQANDTDVLLGGAGNDRLTSKSGADTLDGGSGNDDLNGNGKTSYVFGRGSGQDVIRTSLTGDRILLNADVSLADLTVTRTGQDVVLQILGSSDRITILNFYQNSIDNYVGSSVKRLTFASGGSIDVDAISGFTNLPTEQNDLLFGTALPDTIDGLDGNDLIDGGLGNDIILGGAGDDMLFGGDGNDTLDGGSGNDSYAGGKGDDLYIVDEENLQITELMNEGIDTIQSSVSISLRNNIENLTLVGSALNAYGNELDNVIIGNEFDNYLEGGGGRDTLIGGAGNDILNGNPSSYASNSTLSGGTGDDTYNIFNATDVIVENTNEGNDWVFAYVSYTLGVNVENLGLQDGDDLNGTGNDLNNSLSGNSGNNILDGKAGADIMTGGSGNDIYVVDNAGDIVVENTAEGTDTVQSSIDYTLGTNLENLSLTGTANINGTGNSVVNILMGNSGNNLLNGGAGADKLIGGTGDDTYIVDNTGDLITENTNSGSDTVQSSVTYTLAANVENLTLTGTGAISGIGNALDNVLSGNSAVNKLTGGAGNDTYYVGAGDTVIEAASEGTDTVISAVTWTLAANVENLTLIGATAINATGNADANIIIGNTGDNVLSGGGGADTMIGGAGNDTYMVDNTADVVTENAAEGSDQVQSSATYTLLANIEALYLTGSGSINGTGNVTDNLIVGNSGINTLNGAAGNDILQGGAGVDTLTDTLGNNVLDGGVGADIITAGAGNDFIIGGTGNDTITTGQGADIIAFNRGDGMDTINASTVKDNTLSLGKGITYADLLFKKSGNDLILVTGASEQMTIKDWYLSTANHNIANLQIVIEGTADYKAASSSVINNKKIEQFNFDGLVTKFDQARVATPSLTSWALSSSLLGFYLAGTDTAAIGGDLAYQYAKNGNLTTFSMVPAETLLVSPQFGIANQALQNVGTLMNASPRLI